MSGRTDFAHLLPDTYYSLYVESLGGSPLIIGSILSASWFIMTFLQLAGGFLYEVVSPTIPFLLLLTVMAFTAVATAIFLTEPQKKEA
ncbi:MAG: hypothetical protein QXY88_01590 [Candidatus Bathyarchaeia archaeon]